MPKRRTELPKGIRNNLPPHAQDIWLEAYNNALEEYADPRKRDNPREDKESVAAQVAWSAVKHKYQKGEDGKWYEKREEASV